MSFTDALANAAPAAKRLKVDDVLDAMAPDIAAEARQALEGTVPARQVSRAFTAVGHPVSENAINKWRQRRTDNQ